MLIYKERQIRNIKLRSLERVHEMEKEKFLKIHVFFFYAFRKPVTELMSEKVLLIGTEQRFAKYFNFFNF